MIRSTYILLWPILALTLGSIGCGTETNPSNPEYKYGNDMSIRIPLSKTVAAQIARAELIVSAGGEILMTEELVVDGEAITGTIKEVPAGGGRRFTVNAYDQQGVIAYSGFSVATVIANDTITVPVTLTPVGSSGSAIKGDIDLPLPNGSSMSFVLVEAGTCLVGSTPSEVGHQPDEAPATLVDIPYDYYVGIVEVTEEQWVTVMNTTLWEGGFDPDRPARNMDWYAASAFALETNSWNGENLVRLPSEVEWECASRASTESRWSFGNSQAELADHAWYETNSGGVPSKVGQKLPNQWGAFDMPGNVQEWTLSSHDAYPPNVFTTFEDGFLLEEPATPVARGGSYASAGNDTRAAARKYAGRSSRANAIGFRLVMKVGNSAGGTDSDEASSIVLTVRSPVVANYQTKTIKTAVTISGEIENPSIETASGVSIQFTPRNSSGGAMGQKIHTVGSVPPGSKFFSVRFTEEAYAERDAPINNVDYVITHSLGGPDVGSVLVSVN
jgi:formylglycine-generating enzyme required for sulfatase activity